MTNSAIIFGFESTRLNQREIDFFREVRPAGYIVFQRNCQDPQQLRRLTDELREINQQEELLILIDQEGGRVARLKPPHWRHAPAAGAFACIAETDKTAARRLVYLNARMIAKELVDAGINVNCAPLLDVPTDECHGIIGDRAYGKTPEQVAYLGLAMAEGLLDGGVLPVIKHIPGHGRALVDSHENLPVVTASLANLRQDFQPFKELSHLPLAMTAHIRYTALDELLPATLSPKIINLIRTELKFDGLLMSDDLSMQALQGDFAHLTRHTLDAGCDLVLHCNGKMEEMQQIADAAGDLNEIGKKRLSNAWNMLAKHIDSHGVIEEYKLLAKRAGLE